MDELLDIINSICREKTARGIIPAAATYSEIVSRMSRSHEDIKTEINKLVKNGRLTWRRTLNEFSFKTTEKK